MELGLIKLCVRVRVSQAFDTIKTMQGFDENCEPHPLFVKIH